MVTLILGLPLYYMVTFILYGYLILYGYPYTIWLPLYYMVTFILYGYPYTIWLPLYHMVTLILYGYPYSRLITFILGLL